MFKQLDNKIIILTGASGLIGRATLKKLEDLGATVIAVDLIKNEDYNHFIQCDVTDISQLDYLVTSVNEQFGRIDGLINLAYPRTKDWGTKFENIPFERNFKYYRSFCDRFFTVEIKKKF